MFGYDVLVVMISFKSHYKYISFCFVYRILVSCGKLPITKNFLSNLLSHTEGWN